MSITSDAPEAVTQATEPPAPTVDEVQPAEVELIEDVSIDGMCGVY